MTNPIRAVYRLREDGDYDFMAAFANDEGRWDGDVAETYAENLRSEGEEVIVKEFADLSNLVDVLELQPNVGTANDKSSNPAVENLNR